MPGDTHPADVLVAELAGLYGRGTRRLEAIVHAGLARGLRAERLGQPDQRVGDATHAYRVRQLAQARAVLAELNRQAGTVAPLVIGRAYASGVVSVDASLRLATARGAFGRVHVRAVEELAGNLTRSLRAAADRAGANVELVFERADALEGALPASGRVAGVPFLGRRLDDPYRRLALETVGTGTVALDTRRQVSAELRRRLITEGVTDAATGFVDRAGRRWSLEAYAAMVARTTTREAMTAGTMNRLGEHGIDLVAITSHPHQHDECSPYDGRTFSLSGRSTYPRLDRRPPFHPNCRHVIGPASEDLDAFEAELELNAGGAPPAPAPDEPSSPPSPIPRSLVPGHSPEPPNLRLPRDAPAPPLSPVAQPQHDRQSAQRLDDQRALASLVAGDPGLDEEESAARWKAITADEDELNRALNRQLGGKNTSELRRFLDRSDSVKAGYRQQILRGEMTLEDLEQTALEDYQDRESRRDERERKKAALSRRACPCFVCGRFKRRPADVCDYCGDDPTPGVNYAGGLSDGAGKREAAIKFNRARGYED